MGRVYFKAPSTLTPYLPKLKCNAHAMEIRVVKLFAIKMQLKFAKKRRDDPQKTMSNFKKQTYKAVSFKNTDNPEGWAGGLVRIQNVRKRVNFRREKKK